MIGNKKAKTIVFFSLVLAIYLAVNPLSVSASSILMKKGQRSSAVKQLQDDLKELGYFSAKSTGYYGSITESSVRRFQNDYGLYVDGMAGSNTLNAINSAVEKSRLLKKGMRGSHIRDLQQDLKQLGYFDSDATGYYGSITEEAVEEFQQENGLYVDGIAGENTISILEKKLNTESSILKKGCRGDDVVSLQKDLKRLGFFSAGTTGYYGTITENSVKKLQKNHGIKVDGIAGANTLALIAALKSGNNEKAAASVSRSSDVRDDNCLMPWFKGVEEIFKRGSVATVYDVETGISFRVKRTYGTNHADCEPLTKADTAAMLKASGGKWSWTRRAITVTVDGQKFAASMNCMPHAGVDKYSEGAYVSGRSAGYNYGYNFDAVKGNNFNGHFCIHFYMSRTHGTNRVDEKHLAMVRKAAAWVRSQ